MTHLPNFLIIGTARAGTTALYSVLDQHPEVYMSPNKEPGFFLLEGKDVPSTYENEVYTVTNIEDYRRLFDGVQAHHKAYGEATTGYLLSEGVPERIEKYVPDIRMIAILRNPIDRAYSEYELAFRESKETRTFKEAIAAEPIEPRTAVPFRSGFPIYMRQGFYYEHLSRFYSYFDKDQISILLHEDWKKNPGEVSKQIYQFIGVDPDFDPDLDQRYNVGGVPKSQFVYDTIFNSKQLKSFARKVVPRDTLRRIQATLSQHLLDRSKQGLRPEIREHLKQVYREDVEKLQVLIGRDLSHWLA